MWLLRGGGVRPGVLKCSDRGLLQGREMDERSVLPGTHLGQKKRGKGSGEDEGGRWPE